MGDQCLAAFVHDFQGRIARDQAPPTHLYSRKAAFTCVDADFGKFRVLEATTVVLGDVEVNSIGVGIAPTGVAGEARINNSASIGTCGAPDGIDGDLTVCTSMSVGSAFAPTGVNGEVGIESNLGVGVGPSGVTGDINLTNDLLAGRDGSFARSVGVGVAPPGAVGDAAIATSIGVGTAAPGTVGDAAVATSIGVGTAPPGTVGDAAIATSVGVGTAAPGTVGDAAIATSVGVGTAVPGTVGDAAVGTSLGVGTVPPGGAGDATIGRSLGVGLIPNTIAGDAHFAHNVAIGSGIAVPVVPSPGALQVEGAFSVGATAPAGIVGTAFIELSAAIAAPVPGISGELDLGGTSRLRANHLAEFTALSGITADDLLILLSYRRPAPVTRLAPFAITPAETGSMNVMTVGSAATLPVAPPGGTFYTFHATGLIAVGISVSSPGPVIQGSGGNSAGAYAIIAFPLMVVPPVAGVGGVTIIYNAVAPVTWDLVATGWGWS